MNITQIFPESELDVYKVTDVLDDSQMSLLNKFAKGRIPTGYKQDELDQLVQDIRSASIEACKTIFDKDSLTAVEENKRWPWFDLSEGESRDVSSNGTFHQDDLATAYFAELVLKQGVGGQIKFIGQPETLVQLAPGEMLVGSRSAGHEFEILEVSSGTRLTLMTRISSS